MLPAVAEPPVRIRMFTVGVDAPGRLVTPAVRGTEGVLGGVGHATIVHAPLRTGLTIGVASSVVAIALAASFNVTVTGPHVSCVDDLRSLLLALKGAASTEAQRANDCKEHHACWDMCGAR